MKKNSILNNNNDSGKNFNKKSLKIKLKNIILKNMDKRIFAEILFLLERNTKN